MPGSHGLAKGNVRQRQQEELSCPSLDIVVVVVVGNGYYNNNNNNSNSKEKHHDYYYDSAIHRKAASNATTSMLEYFCGSPKRLLDRMVASRLSTLQRQ